MTESDPAADEAAAEGDAYSQRMQRRKAIQDRRMSETVADRGLVIVHTGAGKGKTTAALGMVLRSLGHGHRVAIVQFIKGKWEPAEKRAFEPWGNQLEFHATGEGFTWETQDRARDRAMAQAGWEVALGYLADPQFRLVLLDEVNIALKKDYLSVEQVLTGVKAHFRVLKDDAVLLDWRLVHIDTFLSTEHAAAEAGFRAARVSIDEELLAAGG